jgi:hypothetical protein
MLAVGPAHEATTEKKQVDIPAFFDSSGNQKNFKLYDDMSDDGLSEGTNEKPLKFEEFQQRVEQMYKLENKSKKKSKNHMK